MDPDDGLEDDGPVFAWLPPDDRLWRHPSELLTNPPAPRARSIGVRELEHRIWTVALLAGVVGAVLATGVGVVAGRYDRTTTVVRPVERVVDTTSALVAPASNPKETGVVDIAARLRPAIVELQIDGDGGAASGSGVVFRSDGYVLTNNHVVAGARAIVAVMADGHRVAARLVGADPLTDIAVVKLTGSNRPFATLGTASDLKVGQLAVAIGSPLGLAGGPSVTVGVVSALGRRVNATNGPQLLDMIQTDAPIAPGSSGGALVDGGGDVIGITTAVSVSDGGPGFATPIDIAHDVAQQLINRGHVTHVWLGVDGEDVNDDLAGTLRINGGAVVRNVVTNSPAAKAGIVDTDVITDVDGKQIFSMGALIVAMRGRRPGDKVTLGLIRGGHYRTTQAVLVEQPADPGSS